MSAAAETKSPRRLTPVFADGPAPPPLRPARRAFRIARMTLPVIVLLYAALCGRWLIAAAGLNPLHWTRAGLHLRDAIGQGVALTIVLLGFHIALRMGKTRKARR